MKIFLTCASGYIGGSVAHKLIQQGHQVYGLVRSPEKAELVAKSGVSPVLGSLDDTDRLVESAHNSDAVINTASSDHRPAVVNRSLSIGVGESALGDVKQKD
jgi:uncharacterized protein YbjT (DUF2867 family)